MASEYDPVFPAGRTDRADLDHAAALFAAASRPFRSSPVPWLAWGLILPAAALATRTAAGRFGPPGAMGLWTAAVLAGGAVEAGTYWRRRVAERSALASWVLRAQGNLSLVAVALSGLLLWLDRPQALPGVWLLLLGHSLATLGGLAFAPLRPAGLLYQAGGLAALWPHGLELEFFAATAAAANLWVAAAVARERAASGQGGSRGGQERR